MAERNKERRRTASYKRSFAYLNSKQGRLDEAHVWAQDAREGYECLGAEQEVQKMDTLIRDLRVRAEQESEKLESNSRGS